MKISVKESTLVKPIEETPSGGLWLSNLDILMPEYYHALSFYFYRFDSSANFFDAAVLKAALSRALVDFYPYAGRLRNDENGRVEINCNGEGVLFVVAECDATMDDLGDFTPRASLSALIPKADYSQGISSFPLLMFQITRFECGGVSLGVASDHHVADGMAALHCINTWSDIARGVTATATSPPFMDRRLLSARKPPLPHFPHIEHQPPPSLRTPLDISVDETILSHKSFSFTRDQINALKAKCKHDGGSSRLTTFEVLAGHVWRCVCVARRLPPDQETKLQFPLDGRARLRPPLPTHYFGNGIFLTTAVARCGDMESSNAVSFAARKVQEAVARIDDEYMRSSLDYIEVQLPKSAEGIVRGARHVGCPNIGITSWVRLPFYDADFGWGKPVFAGPGEAMEGKSFLFADPDEEGTLSIAIALFKPHMELLQELLYQF